jgi:hypothetical protein
VHEGIITPVPAGLHISDISIDSGNILAVKSIDNIAIVIVSSGLSMAIYRFDLDETTNRITKNYGEIWQCKIWDSYSDIPK